MIIAALLVGANLSYGQTVPLTFKTSAGVASATVSGATTSSILYADVTNTGSSSVTGIVTLAAAYPVSTGARTGNVIPVVSNDGTNWAHIKSGLNWASYAAPAAQAFFSTGYDTLIRGTSANPNVLSDTAIGTSAYKFPTGYRYVGFKWVGVSGTVSSFTAKGLAK